MKTAFFLLLVSTGCLTAFSQTETPAPPTPVATPASEVQAMPSLAVPAVSPSMPEAGSPATPTPPPSPEGSVPATPPVAVPAPAPVGPENGTPAAMVEKTADAPVVPAPSEEETVTKLEQDWGDAIMRHDADFLDGVETDDYTYTGPDGVLSHKTDDLAAAKENFAHIESFKHRDVKVRLYGETAIVIGATTLKGTAGGTDLSGEFRWTDVFVRREGRWRAVASQATAISRPAHETE